MSEYIEITPNELSKHTRDNGICDLWQVLYEIVCPDRDESRCIEYGGKNNHSSILLIDKHVNITDMNHYNEWSENINSLLYREYSI